MTTRYSASISMADKAIFVGNSVTAGVPMEATTMGDLWQRVRNDDTLKNEVERLRKVKAMDAEAYTRLKVRLPYFCGGEFRGGLRRSEHLVGIDAFVLDVDHFSNDESTLEALKRRLAADERVVMAFRSPGGDGMKVVFGLDSVCTDTKLFSDAYKAFAFRFAEQYDLTKFMDFRTADATRICFLSHDATAYFNPMAELLRWETLIPSTVVHFPKDNSIPFADDAPMAAEAGRTVLPSVDSVVVVSTPKAAEAPENRSHNIAPDVYADILRKLQTKARPNPMKREVVQPERLQLVVAPVAAALLEQGIQLTEVKDIQFGKQMRMACGSHTAEANVFYGKRGFSVVEVVRNVHQSALSGLCLFIIQQTIYKEFSEDGKA